MYKFAALFTKYFYAFDKTLYRFYHFILQPFPASPGAISQFDCR
jgi:hypothetical protein